LDIDELKKELANLTDVERDYLIANSSKYLKIAILRGSSNSIAALIDVGLSPFALDKDGKSIYTQDPINSVHLDLIKSLYDDGTYESALYLETKQIPTLIQKVNEKSIPCDAVISRIYPNRNYRPYLLEILKGVKNCQHSSRSEHLGNVFTKYFEIYVKSDFQDSEVVTELFKILPPEARLVKIRESGTEDYLIHPIAILQAIIELNPAEIKNKIESLKSLTNENDPLIISRVRDSNTYKTQTISTFRQSYSEVSSIKISKFIRRHYSEVCPKNASDERCTEFRHLDPKKLAEDKSEEELNQLEEEQRQ
jgi:hypothetical protein